MDRTAVQLAMWDRLEAEKNELKAEFGARVDHLYSTIKLEVEHVYGNVQTGGRGDFASEPNTTSPLDTPNQTISNHQENVDHNFTSPPVNSIPTSTEPINNLPQTNSVAVDRAQDSTEPENNQPQILTEVTRDIKEENEMTLKNVMDKATQTNEQIEDCVKQEIKEEFEDGEVMVIKEEEENLTNNIEEVDENSQQQQQSNQQIEEVVDKDGSSRPVTTQQTVDWVEPEIKEEFDYGHEIEIKQEEEDETTNNEEMLDIKEEEEEEEGEAQFNDIEDWTEDNQVGGDGESRPVENASMDTTPPHSTGQFQTNISKSSRILKRKRDEPQVRNEVNSRDNQQVEGDEGNDDAGEGTSQSVKRARPSRPTTSSDANEKQVITHTVRCPEVDCPDTFTTVKLLNKHLKEKHLIDAFRCLVKDCGQSFTNHCILGQHLAQSHQSTTQWHCDKCPNHFSTYPQLSNHNIQHHHLGHFECFFPACTFTGEYRRKVYDHYSSKHKQTLNCDHPGCTFRTPKASNLKQHRLIHLDMKPYRCKWTACDFSAAQKGVTIRHIRGRHFAHNSSSGPNGAQLGEPSDYVEVMHDLLR